MIVMGHEPAQIDHMAKTSAYTIYITSYNDPSFFRNLNATFRSTHSSRSLCNEYQYGLVKYNQKQNGFIEVDQDKQKGIKFRSG